MRAGGVRAPEGSSATSERLPRRDESRRGEEDEEEEVEVERDMVMIGAFTCYWTERGHGHDTDAEDQERDPPSNYVTLQIMVLYVYSNTPPHAKSG